MISDEEMNRIKYFISLANVCLFSNDLDQAIKNYQNALDLIQETNINDNILIAQVTHRLGDAHRYKGNIPIALNHYNHALSILEPYRDRRKCMVTILIITGDKHHLAGELSSAIDSYYAANGLLEISAKNNQKKLLRIQQELIEINSHDEKNYILNETEVEKMQVNNNIINSLQKSQRRNETITAHLWHKLGDIARDENDYLSALGYYTRDLNVLEKTYGKDHLIITGTLSKIGYVSHMLSDHLTAKIDFQRALEIRGKSDYPVSCIETVNILNNLGRAYYYLQDMDHAENMLRLALSMLEQFFPEKINCQLMTALCWLARVECTNKKYSIAENMLLEVQKMEETFYGETDNKEIGHTLHHLGIVYMNQGEYSKAEAHLKNAQRIFTEQYSADNRYTQETVNHLHYSQPPKQKTKPQPPLYSFWNKTNLGLLAVAAIITTGTIAHQIRNKK